MKTVFVALLALSLVGTGLVIYNSHAKNLNETNFEASQYSEDAFIPLAEPDQLEVNETMEDFDFEQEISENSNLLQKGVFSCGFCGKNAFTAFTACPASVAEDGFNPWVDFKCISSVLKLPNNCKKCFCAIAHHYRRRVRGC